MAQCAFGGMIGVTKQAAANVESSHSNPSIDFLNRLISGRGEMFISDSAQTDFKKELCSELLKLLEHEGFIRK